MLKVFFSPPKNSHRNRRFSRLLEFLEIQFLCFGFHTSCLQVVTKKPLVFPPTVGVKPSGFHFWQFLGFFGCLPEAWKAPRTGAAWQVGVKPVENCC